MILGPVFVLGIAIAFASGADDVLDGIATLRRVDTR